MTSPLPIVPDWWGFTVFGFPFLKLFHQPHWDSCGPRTVRLRPNANHWFNPRDNSLYYYQECSFWYVAKQRSHLHQIVYPWGDNFSTSNLLVSFFVLCTCWRDSIVYVNFYMFQVSVFHCIVLASTGARLTTRVDLNKAHEMRKILSMWWLGLFLYCSF
jgi:hypothetical protein